MVSIFCWVALVVLFPTNWIYLDRSFLAKVIQFQALQLSLFQGGGSTATTCAFPLSRRCTTAVVPPLVPPNMPSVAHQRQYRRLWRQYRCCGSRAPPGASGTASGTAASAAKAALCCAPAAVPPPTAVVPLLRDLLRAVGRLNCVGR